MELRLLMELFESLVNTEGFQTWIWSYINISVFESLVNTEGFQTTGTDS